MNSFGAESHRQEKPKNIERGHSGVIPCSLSLPLSCELSCGRCLITGEKVPPKLLELMENQSDLGDKKSVYKLSKHALENGQQKCKLFLANGQLLKDAVLDL